MHIELMLYKSITIIPLETVALRVSNPFYHIFFILNISV